VRAGISGIGAHPYMRDKMGEPFSVAMVPVLASTDRSARLFEMAMLVIEEALEAIHGPGGNRFTIHLGLPEASSDFEVNRAAALCRRLSEHFSTAASRIEVRPWMEGNAAGLLALQEAADAIESGRTTCALVGGVDSFIDVDILEALDEQRRVASSSNRWGFPPGEGAGMLAVCHVDFARERQLPILARVVSIASAFEHNGMHSDGICVGRALGAVIAAAAEAGAPATAQYCDIDGDRYREHEFSYALLRVPANTFVNATHYVAPSDCWGNCGAATAPLLTLLPAVARARKAPVGTRPMIWCGSENGRRAAMLLDLTSGG
jgi:3-oxoacyl-[acyl-carrier-protein] synthase-1